MRLENTISKFSVDQLTSVMSPEFRTYAMDKFIHLAPYTAMRLEERLVDLPIRNVVRRSPSLFVQIPKNAGTTITVALYGKFIGHRTAMWYRNVDRQMFESKYKFAVTRDPLDRFISVFHFSRNGGTALVPTSSRASDIVVRYNKIEEFIDGIESGAVSNFKDIDYVFNDQYKYVVDCNNRLIVDKLFKLEEITNTRLSVPDCVIDMRIIANQSSQPSAGERSRRIKDFVEKQYAFDYELLAL